MINSWICFAKLQSLESNPGKYVRIVIYSCIFWLHVLWITIKLIELAKSCYVLRVIQCVTVKYVTLYLCLTVIKNIVSILSCSLWNCIIELWKKLSASYPFRMVTLLCSPTVLTIQQFYIPADNMPGSVNLGCPWLECNVFFERKEDYFKHLFLHMTTSKSDLSFFNYQITVINEHFHMFQHEYRNTLGVMSMRKDVTNANLKVSTVEEV